MYQADLLKDKVILITGGGTGLGKSMATRFLQLGAKIAITSRKEEVLAATGKEYTTRPGAKFFTLHAMSAILIRSKR